MLLRVIDTVVFLAVVWFVLNQLAWPLLRDRPLFPLFRKKDRKQILEERLIALQKRRQERKLEEEVHEEEVRAIQEEQQRINDLIQKEKETQ